MLGLHNKKWNKQVRTWKFRKVNVRFKSVIFSYYLYFFREGVYIKIKEIVPNISNQIISLKIKLKINNKDQLIEKIKSAIYERNK
mgnify:CR=1 FL=1